MKLLFSIGLGAPIGFLALLAIPVLIFIYIIKNRYTEQTVASTYLWTLSERFLKRRVPINRITGIISLLLQILAVILIALLLVHPSISVPGLAKEYCFVIDGSGSMNITQDDKTRFDIGKDKIAEIIDGSYNGSRYTLIYAGSSTETIFEGVDSKDRAKDILSELEAEYEEAGLTGALGVAQSYYDSHRSALTYLVTDKTFDLSENVNLINVSQSSQNYAVDGVEYVVTGGQLFITGKVMSYQSNATLTVDLYFDGSDEVADSKSIEVEQLEEKEFEFVSDNINFASFRVVILERDNLALDNEVTVFNVKYENTAATLLVSNNPFFLNAAIVSSGATQIDTLSIKEYEAYLADNSPDKKSYGLYIYHGYMPESLPKEAAVWFVNPNGSMKGTGFSYQSEGTPGTPATYSTSTSTAVRSMLNGVTKRDFELGRYAKLSLNGKFTTYISCGGDPLLFTGVNENGNRQTVFAFDPAESATFLLSDSFTTLVINLLNYSFPQVIEQTSYYCGETVLVNMITGCESIRIESPLGNISYPDTSTAIAEHKLTEVGTYKIYLIMSDGSEREVNVYASMPEGERAPVAAEASFVLQGAPEEGGLTAHFDSTILMVIFIILGVIVVTDYGVYCYEQYQLR